MSGQIWMGDWVWMLTFLHIRSKRRSVKHAVQKANDALIAYKKRAEKQTSKRMSR